MYCNGEGEFRFLASIDTDFLKTGRKESLAASDPQSFCPDLGIKLYVSFGEFPFSCVFVGRLGSQRRMQ